MFVLGRVPCGGTALGFPTPWEPFCNVRLFSLSGVLPFALSRKRFSRPCPEGLFGCVSRFRPRIALLECVSRRGSGRLSGCVSRRGSGSPAGCVFRVRFRVPCGAFAVSGPPLSPFVARDFGAAPAASFGPFSDGCLHFRSS